MLYTANNIQIMSDRTVLRALHNATLRVNAARERLIDHGRGLEEATVTRAKPDSLSLEWTRWRDAQIALRDRAKMRGLLARG